MHDPQVSHDCRRRNLDEFRSIEPRNIAEFGLDPARIGHPHEDRSGPVARPLGRLEAERDAVIPFRDDLYARQDLAMRGSWLRSSGGVRGPRAHRQEDRRADGGGNAGQKNDSSQMSRWSYSSHGKVLSRPVCSQGSHAYIQSIISQFLVFVNRSSRRRVGRRPRLPLTPIGHAKREERLPPPRLLRASPAGRQIAATSLPARVPPGSTATRPWPPRCRPVARPSRRA